MNIIYKLVNLTLFTLLLTGCGQREKNPLLESFNTPHNTPPFEQIKTQHYEPAFDAAIIEAQKEIEDIATASPAPDFENTIVALDNAGEKLEYISSIFFNLNSSCTNDSMQIIAQNVSPKMTAYSHSVYMNSDLFKRVKQVYDNKASLSLTPEQEILLEKTWRSFINGGANLEGAAKERFKEISGELSTLDLKFNENTLAETNAFELLITDEKQLDGIPPGTKEMAAMIAKKRGKEGWMFTLSMPSYMPVLKYADNRDLREQLYKAYSSRGNRDNANNNCEIIRKMVTLRAEMAQIMGYDTYAAYALSDRMAETPENVNQFLAELLNASHPFALKEKKEVEDFAGRNGFNEELQRWDWSYYSNKLKQEKYAIDDEMLRPYFKLENVQAGIFDLANTLYGLTFKEVDNIGKYNEDVKTFEVYGENGKFMAVLYADFFPRDNKGDGAWMTEFRGQKVKNGEDIRPLVSLVMNFTKPTENHPALLSFLEVSTFLHEFGHALHGMLSQCNYGSTAGTSVYRDFVELPSQIMENWAYEKEWLDKWAVHYETGEKIPEEYIVKLKDAANFQSAYQNDRQVALAMTDMAWHSVTGEVTGSVPEFEGKAMAPTEIFPAVEGCNTSTAFGHIFGGGYAAGYYSYKWAEVLDADAFSVFKQKGIFDQETATSFRKNILEKGGSEHPMTLYKRFRGHEPTVDALLERNGLKS